MGSAEGEDASGHLTSSTISMGDVLYMAEAPIAFSDSVSGGSAYGADLDGVTESASDAEVNVQVTGDGNEFIQTSEDGTVSGGYSGTKGLAYGDGQGTAYAAADELADTAEADAYATALGFGAGVGASFGVDKDSLDGGFGAGSGLSYSLTSATARPHGPEPHLVMISRTGGKSRGFGVGDGKFEGIGEATASGGSEVLSTSDEHATVANAGVGTGSTGVGGAVTEGGAYFADILAVGSGYGTGEAHALIDAMGV